MYEYCFRAQFRADVLVVMSHIPDAVYSIQDLDEKLPDVEVVMSCRHNFDSLRQILGSIPDIECIVKTLALKKDYRSSFGRNQKFWNN